MNQSITPLEEARLEYEPKLAPALKNLRKVFLSNLDVLPHTQREIASRFPLTKNQPLLEAQSGNGTFTTIKRKVGVVLSGGQAPGGHNVIWGLADALWQLNPQSSLIGFLNGPSGLLSTESHILLTPERLADYRNQGGFDLIGSGRTKIESEEQLEQAAATVKALELDGLVIIGGDDSNTNAAVLAEYFADKGIKCRVNGVPKTIDGDLKNQYIETSFGFDTATKIYSAAIGDIARDALSAKKAYYFIKLMGRHASHITLECALKTQPNLALISEEIHSRSTSLDQIVDQIVSLVRERAANEKHYGIILIPEGLIEAIPEISHMIHEINRCLSTETFPAVCTAKKRLDIILSKLSSHSAHCLSMLPSEVQEQLILNRDPHGNVQVSKIETERLLIALVQKELAKRDQEEGGKTPFSAQPIFYGYEGRSVLPSNFDADYCYNLGAISALLIASGATGYLACVRDLKKGVDSWKAGGIPLTSLLHLEERAGSQKPVIKKALVDLRSAPFSKFAHERDNWRLLDCYLHPGAIQYFGPDHLTDSLPLTLLLE
ncbi:MAG: diphosphate--fructose-6-phosphate 1-phosphotransferase, partial [Chlamydiia bacterium]|nr:diphosphate--fructose-6-phosphate 1-phosphotransferase [Chlamydiia bacterium]